jgi:hypothetical protein
MLTLRHLTAGLLLAVASTFALGGSGAAQVATRPFVDWRTVRTEHFDVHYPAEMEAWTLDVASRLESVREAVTQMVGSAPGRRVTIVVEDPSVQSNGSAFPFLEAPVISMWPTPPDPRSQLGNHRGAGEQLAVHEFTHIAHLTRPSRNPRERFLASLLPVQLGPVTRKAPRWITEGYATYVEGKLTGSGRPHSVIRAAILREWALEGKLPTYAQMSAGGGFNGGSMAYLAGSAYLEWLVARSGEESLQHLWRRMSARQDRGFAEAFAGVYGGLPQDLYGRFTVDVTERALQARRTLSAAGLEYGDTVQRLSWTTGDPTVSPDGKHLAIVLRGAPGTPSRVVVWNTAPETNDTAYARAVRRMLERDPQDVAPVRAGPRPKRPLATLLAVNGRGHDAPRFLPSGTEVLVIRSEPTGEGVLRPDLFVWTWKTGRLRRVTHEASIVSADPAPDGRTAAAVRCAGGICDLVRVGLADGRAQVLAKGSPTRVFSRPRFAPDGRTLVASVQERGRWRIARVEAASGEWSYVDPDDGASRYDPSFLTGAASLVETSELGGIANLETLDLATRATRPLTRVTGAAVAPEPDPATGAVFFLSLHGKGLDLNRVRPDSVALGQALALAPSLSPVAPPPPAPGDSLPRSRVSPPHEYGIGPRRMRVLPAGSVEVDGAAAGLTLTSSDPVGRLTLMARGLIGGGAEERGASVSAAWRGSRPSLHGDLFWMRRRPSERGFSPLSLDADYAGGTAFAERAWGSGRLRQSLRGGGSLGRLDRGDADAGQRGLGFVEYAGSFTRARGAAYTALALSMNGSAGRTEGAGWQRGVATLTLAAGSPLLSLRGDATVGVVGRDAPEWERFVVGGAQTQLADAAIFSQRISMAGLPFGTAAGTQVLALRGSTRLGLLTPYYWAATTSGDLEGWHRVVGAEASYAFTGGNILFLPAARFLAGAAYSLDDPWRHRARIYASVAYRP